MRGLNDQPAESAAPGQLRRVQEHRSCARIPPEERQRPVISGKSVAGPASTVIVARGQSLVGARHGVLYLAAQGGSSQPHVHHRGCLLRSSGQRLRLPRRRAHRPPSQTLRCWVTPPPSTRCTLPPKSFYKRILSCSSPHSNQGTRIGVTAGQR